MANPPAPVNAYDAVPYPGHPYSQTHPSRLEMLGLLQGLRPAPANACRVLEIGCGDGANLIPLAYTLPGSHFVGVDLAEQPVGRGREIIDALGLKNIELHALDLRNLPTALGSFDYLIAHGVFSWASPVVAEAILALAGERLTPEGIAYVSYNAQPGGHLREMTRQMMLYHTRDIADPARKVHQSIALLKFLGQSGAGEPNLYQQLLSEAFERAAQRFSRHGGGVFFHDALAEYNVSYYFHEVVAMAARHGLRFLCESQWSPPRQDEFTPAAFEALEAMRDDVIAFEQFTDFLVCRQFRQTLLCRAQKAANHSAAPPDRLRGLFIAGFLRPDAGQDATLTDAVPMTFRGRGKTEMHSVEPLVKAAVLHIGEVWPATVALDELPAIARARLASAGMAPAEDMGKRHEEDRGLGVLLLAAFLSGATELSPRLPRRAPRLSERPEASSLARLQLKLGRRMTNLDCEVVDFEGSMVGHLLAMLDGRHDRAALLDGLMRAWENGAELTDSTGQRISDAAAARAYLEANLEGKLTELLHLALLVA